MAIQKENLSLVSGNTVEHARKNSKVRYHECMYIIYNNSP